MEHEDSYKRVSGPKYECLLFGKALYLLYVLLTREDCLVYLFLKVLLPQFADVDDTLYPLSSGISAQCTKNIIGTLAVLFNLIFPHIIAS